MKLYTVFVKRDFDDAVEHMRENIFPNAIFYVGECGEIYMAKTTTCRYEDVYNEKNNVPF